MDCSPPGSSVHGILQTGILEWVAIAFSRGSSDPGIEPRSPALWAFPGSSPSKESTCNAGDPDSIPESGSSPGEGNSYPLQYSCLENSMDRGAWWATVHGVIESHATEQLRLSLFTFLHWRKWQPTPVFLPGESQGRGSLVGCRLWGRTESDTTEATKQQQQQGYNLQASLSMEFSRQEYWSGLPFCSPWDLPNLGIKHKSPALQADSLPSESPRKPINKRHF